MRPVTKRALAKGSPWPGGPVCLACRLQRRAFASSTPPAPPRPAPSGIAPLRSRQLIALVGPDAAKFLQGIVTANVTAPDGSTARPDACYAGFLNATGRVLHDVFIYPSGPGFGGDGNSFLIETDAAQVDTLARYIRRYKLRAKVDIRKVPAGEISVWQAWDDNATPDAAAPVPPTDSTTLVRDPRAPGMGHRILQLGDGAPAADVDAAPEDAYTIRRYLRGVAEGQGEIVRESSLPQESNMDMMNGIDFHKGCYVGQELTIRTRHRGVVRKRILPCVVYGKDGVAPPESLEYDPAAGPAADAVPPQTSIGRFEKRGRSAGKWLGGVGNIGLGLCRLEIMTPVTLPGETASAGFDPSHEFVLEWGGDDAEGAAQAKSGVKVKAFVPDWLQAGLDAAAKR